MQKNVNTNIERIIAKIDNDFNPDNSDWIPRVGAWAIDAMSQIDVLRTKRKRKKVLVHDRIAYSECDLDNNIKVYDNNGCEIKEASESQMCKDCFSTGEESRTICTNAANTISAINTGKTNTPNQIAETINDKYPYRYNIHNTGVKDIDKNYVIVDCNKVELNFDTNFIYIETEYVETSMSKVFGCELPVIPNNGILIEAIVYYCMYKMLCRGYKHPVFNLKASQYGTNPYFEWTQLKDKAKTSVINDGFNDDVTKIFRSSFFISTFDSRR